MSPTTWEAHHSPRASPEGCGELPRSLVTPQWPKLRYPVLYPIDSHPFHSMSIWHPIPEIQHFKNLTLKIKGQGHGCGNNSKSQCGSNIRSTHIPFVPCQSSLSFLSYDFFQNLTLKFKGQGYGWGHSSKSQCGSNILSTHIPFVPCQSALPFLKYSIFKIWPWKSRVMVKWP